MDFKFQVQTKVLKPVAEVFDAVINPKKLSGYFTRTATPMLEGGTAMWSFPELPGEFPVKITRIIPSKLITFDWDTLEGDYQTHVEIEFEPYDAQSTIVKISESGWKPTQKGLDGSYLNCQGWTHMSLCMKAFLEYGINLRQGSFPDMSSPGKFESPKVR